MKELVHLIQSLTAQEKKFFREMSTSEKLLQLFDFIDKNKLVDVAQIKEQPFYHRATPNKLQSAILKSLRTMHEDLSDERKIDNILHEFDILVNKKQFKLAERKVTDGLALCHASNKGPKSKLRLLEALRFVQYYTKSVSERMESNSLYIDDLRLITDELKQFELFLAGHNKIRFPDKSSGIEAICLEQKEVFEAIQSFDRLKSINFNYHRYTNQLRLIQLKAEDDEMQEGADATLKHLSAQKKLSRSVRDNNSAYGRIYDLMIIMIIYTKVRDYDAAYKVYKLIISTNERSPLTGLLMVNQVFAAAIHLLLKMNKPSEAIQLIEKEVPRWDSHLVESNEAMAVVLLTKSMAYFCNKNFKRANEFLREYNSSKLNLRKETTRAIQFYEIVIHCEQGKLNLAVSRKEALLRSIKKSKAISEFDLSIYRFIDALINEKKEEMKKELATARTLLEDKTNSQANGSEANAIFNFISWMESNVYGTPFVYG